ncbi:hypothetical protein QFC19_008850 [Naganishia cerealis]|uniref:Uncharacterized protein n=1 Tax=Naganishia cerealis TaxID=610337 RepID=A0ACC2UZ97_9TREE|nr:hypothetical protein QFC19_008850 [Naganishia cerealis]
MAATRNFVFVTGNANKLREVQQILAVGDSGIQVTNQALDVPEVQGSTQEVAIAKCKSAAEQLGKACVTEDTALCFDALGGLPGPYIKDFMTKVGHEGKLHFSSLPGSSRSYPPHTPFLQGLNAMLQGFPTKRAYALCTFAYSPAPTPTDPFPTPILFEGKTEGEIVPARGDKVFGWDPIFMPDEGNGLTYAEMDPVEKNRISHRYKALSKLKEYLQSLGQ